MQQQAKNLKTYLNNIPYDRKELVEEHILKLINSNESHFVQTGVAKNLDDSFYCYIEIIGWIQIGKQLHQIRILFPHNYPVAMPQFHLAHKPQDYTITNEALMISSRVISFQTNSENEKFIRLDYPSVKNMWANDRKIVQEAYKQVRKNLNSPPLLTPKTQPLLSHSKPLKHGGLNPNNQQSKAQKFLTEAEMSGLIIEEKKIQLENIQSQNYASLARMDFLQRHLPKLSKAMKNCEQQCTKKLNEIQSVSRQVHRGVLDSLLVMSQEQKRKIDVLATKEGLKEGERRLIKFLEKSLPENKVNLSEYRNVIKGLYQKMFQAQCSFLKLSD